MPAICKFLEIFSFGVYRKPEAKFKAQCEAVKLRSTSTSNVLNRTRIYINGYLENATYIEMKVILEAGGIAYVKLTTIISNLELILFLQVHCFPLHRYIDIAGLEWLENP